MPIQLQIKDDLARLDKVLLRHEKALTTKAVPQAINRTLATVTSTAVKDISATTGYKQKDVRKQIIVRKANRKSITGSLDARSAQAENLIAFVKPSQRNPHTFRKRARKGFKYAGVKAKAWRQNKTYPGTFVGKGQKSGKLLVFKRGSSGRVEGVIGPSIRREFIQAQLTTTMKKIAGLRFRIELSAAINNQVRRQT